MDHDPKTPDRTPWTEHEPVSSPPPAPRPIPLPPSSAPQATPVAETPPASAPAERASIRSKSGAGAAEPAREEPPRRPAPTRPVDLSADPSPAPPRSPEAAPAFVVGASRSGEGPAGEPEGYSDDDFDREQETFADSGAARLGIVGGRFVGKTYLFRAMVYRTYARLQSGALASYLDGIRLFRAVKKEDKVQTMNLARFVKRYAAWEKLPSTKLEFQEWFRLRLRYRTGILGRTRSALDVDFFDGSGEALQGPWTPENRQLWNEVYREAGVMVFCLPLWAAFPGPDLVMEDWQAREELLEGFEQVVQNYTDMLAKSGQTRAVFSILALTQADDRRSALRRLNERWIRPYMEDSHTYLSQLRRGGNVARYLANARTVSSALYEELAATRDPRVGSIPESLNFGRGRPWLMPVSAVEGSILDSFEGKSPGVGAAPLPPPVPVHVELPLLVALCERSNALM
jgi:hypothetical protein